MPFKAIIFDFDGVITDTEPVHMQAWLEVFEPLGISFEKEEYETNYVGLNDRDFLDAVGQIHRHPFGPDEKKALIERKLARTLALLQENIPLLPGVKEFIDRARPNHLCAICSGASKIEIRFVLEKLGWLNLFDPIVTQEDVGRGKPHPDGFILTLEKLNGRPGHKLITAEDCLVVEDSPKGIAAAHAAGMKCLAISNSFKPETLKEADWITDSLAHIDPKAMSL